jgi:serine/threonine protein phosphatase PrpC
MTGAELRVATISANFAMKPGDDEIDLFGLTHRGHVRAANEDHFLLATIHPQVVVHSTSLPNPEHLAERGERFATLMLVADGVGGGVAGADASRLAIESVTHYVSHTLRCYKEFGGAEGNMDGLSLADALRAAANTAHAAVRAEWATRDETRSMATTLTLALAVWPWAYIVQVGDSRCYLYQEGKLVRLTRDQTVAQQLADEGVLPQENIARSPFAHVLASAIGAEESLPEITRVEIKTRSLFLLCSDGLTKHVTDEEIADAVRTHDRAEGICRSLVDLALERGGTDNVTVIVGRARGST